MKWSEVKEETGIAGNLTFEIERAAGYLRSVTFSLDGRPILMVGKNDYSMVAYVPAPPEFKDCFVLAGNFLGLTNVSEVFEQEYEAVARLTEYQKSAGYPEDCGLKVEKQKVEVK